MIRDKVVAEAMELISHEYSAMEGYISVLENGTDSLEAQLEEKDQENQRLKAEIVSLKQELAEIQAALVEAHLTDNR